MTRLGRIPLTDAELARRAKALIQSTAPFPASGNANASIDAANEEAPTNLELCQAELAREAAEGRGIDALYRILSTIKSQCADDEACLLAAIDGMKNCAERHLIEHDYETVDAIFRAVFPTLNGSLDADAINLDADREIQRLASLPFVKYERERITLF